MNSAVDFQVLKRGARWLARAALWPALLATVLTWSARGELVLANFSAANPIKVMAIGDSITDDCVHNGAWRQFLQPMLETNGYPFTFVGRQISPASPGFTQRLHEGYCGAVIAAPGVMTTPVHNYAGSDVYLMKIVADALTNTFPDLVLIVMGANDIGRGRDPYWVATNDMPQLLDLVFSRVPTANVIITKTTTLRNAVLGYSAFQTNVPVYNGALQAMVNQRRALGQNLFLADMYSAVDYATMFDADHLHPNLLGLNAMAKEFFSRIQAITMRTNAVTATLIHGGADWRYSDTGQDPGTNWVSMDYDDSAWSHGPSRLGFDTIAGTGPFATTVSYGGDRLNKYPTTYYRGWFPASQGVAFTNLNFRLTRADGAVVWLNGQEAFRVGLPAGTIAYTNLANTHVYAEAVYTYFPTNLTVTTLPAGTNLVAVEVHLYSASTPWAGFDLELIGDGYFIPAPTLSIGWLGDKIQLSWPVVSGGGYTLCSTTSLPSAGGWTPAGASLQTNGAWITTSLVPSDAARFFRLEKR